MRLLILGYFFLSYSVGIVSMTLIAQKWHRTKLPAWGVFLFFLLAFTAFNVNFNAGFVLNSVMGLTIVWEGLPYLALSSVFFSAFNLAIALFSHKLTTVRVWLPLRLFVYAAALSPLPLAVLEMIAAAQGHSTPGTRLDQLEGFEIVNGLFLLYNTAFFLLFRKRAVNRFFRHLIGLILTLNLVFIPLFTSEIVLNYHFLTDALRPISLDNAYYFIGNIICIVLLWREMGDTGERSEPSSWPNTAPGLPLSERESEIVKLVEEGLSNKQIAQRLFIESSTVRNHLYRISGRFGAHSRLDLIRKVKEWRPETPPST
jgi:DNA-binding CsgD family transcriptional regulator